MFDLMNNLIVIWGLALLHIALVVWYSKKKKWGNMEWNWKTGIFRSPGGAISSNLPIVEALVVLAMMVVPQSPSALIVSFVAWHMIRVRTILFILFGLPVFVMRWMKGFAVNMCMDTRVTYLLNTIVKSVIALHNEVCGAFVTLTFAGFFPGLLVVAILMVIGINVPLWGVWVALVPYLFLYSKHWHIIPAFFPDTLEQLTEGLGTKISTLYFGAESTTQQALVLDHH